MLRDGALKVVLVVVGLLFLALSYPMTMFFSRDPAVSMMMSLYVTLGIFLLWAARNPPANRSLIAFTAWSSFAHAAIMGAQAYLKVVQRQELFGVGVLTLIGALLVMLAPLKASAPGLARSVKPVD